MSILGGAGAPVLFPLALALHQQGQVQEAVDIYRQILGEDPDHADALHLMGVALAQQGRPAEALPLLRRAVALSPDFVDARVNLGRACREAHQYLEAWRAFAEAARRRPDDAELSLLADESHQEWLSTVRAGAFALDEEGEPLRAAEHVAAALAQAPGEPSLIYWQARGLMHAGDHAGARRLLAGLSARELAEDADRAWHWSLLNLATGHLDIGWHWHDARFDARSVSVERRLTPWPEWDGSDPAGRCLLLWGEQGVADELWYLHLAGELADRGARVLLELTPRLQGLAARSLPGVTVLPRSDAEQPPQLPEGVVVDAQLSLASLPRFLRPQLASFDVRERWLGVDPVRAEAWRGWLGGLGGGLKVGLSWRSMGFKRDRIGLAYPPLSALSPLLKVPGVQFVSLQYDDDGDVELAALQALAPGRLHRPPELDLKDDFEGQAALIHGLDLVIGPANAPVVLAAALGKPAHALWSDYLRIFWRRLGQEDMPWFSTMTVHYRRWDQPWDDHLAGVAGELASLATDAHPGH